MNKAILIGNLTRDPEVRTTGSGTTVCTFTIAVNRRFQNQAGERVSDFFNIVAMAPARRALRQVSFKGTQGLRYRRDTEPQLRRERRLKEIYY